MSKKIEEADVCLVLEGTYPYVSGGVSTWVHQIIASMPELKFSILFIGAEKRLALEEKYEIPHNVVAIEKMFLFDELPSRDRVPSRRRQATREEVYSALGEMLAGVNRPGERERFASLVSAVSAAGRGMACANLWTDRVAWDLVRRIYADKVANEPFLDFFWTARFLVQPAWRAMRAAESAPPAKVYHSLCTGYAGLVAAVAADRSGSRFLLSEHGIYVRERLAEIQRAEWIPEIPQRLPELFEDLPTLRRMWVEFFKLLGRIGYDSADTITSLFSRNAEFQVSFGAPEEKIEIIPNGIRPDKFAAVAQRRSVLIEQNPGRRNVGFLGRVVQIKDVKTLIKAARSVADEMPEVRFLIAGSTDEEPDYAAACADLVRSLELEDVVEFLGPTDRDELLVETDVMLLTSVSEGLPFVVIESFGTGIPVVSTDVGSCRELISGKSDESPALGDAGSVVPVGDSAAIARALLALLGDRDRAAAMGEAGRLRAAEYYDEADVVRRYRELYTGGAV